MTLLIPNDLVLLFTILESIFQLAVPIAITDSKTKYNYCIAYLPPEIKIIARDITIFPDTTDPYKILKEII